MFTPSTNNYSSVNNNINTRMATYSSNRPATGLRSANYTGYSSINGGINFFNNYNIRSSYLNHTTSRQHQPPEAGLTTSGLKSSRGSRFDPLNQRTSMQLASASQAIKDPLASIISKEKQTVYDKMKQLEKIVHELVESSSIVAMRGEYKLALIKAKDAQAKMNTLKRVYEKNLLTMEQLSSSSSPPALNGPQSNQTTRDGYTSNNSNQVQNFEEPNQDRSSMIPMTNGVNINGDSLMVMTNLALQLLNNGQLNQALEVYNEQLNNQLLSNQSNLLDGGSSSAGDKIASRFGINLANEYFKQGLYQSALKYYRLTLDRISSNDYNNFRIKLMFNIGLTFIKSQQYLEAITAFNHIITDNNINNNNNNSLGGITTNSITSTFARQTNNNVHHHQCGLHLILCNYIIKDRDSIKLAYQKLIEVDIMDQFKDPINDSVESNHTTLQATTTSATASRDKSNSLKPQPQQQQQLQRDLHTGSSSRPMMGPNKSACDSDGTPKGMRSQYKTNSDSQILIIDRNSPLTTTTTTTTSRHHHHHQLQQQQGFTTRKSTAISSASSTSANITGSGASLNSFSATTPATGLSIRPRLGTPNIESISGVIGLGVGVSDMVDDLERSSSTMALSFVRNAIRNDPLHKLIKAKTNQIQRSIIMSAKLLANLDDINQHNKKDINDSSEMIQKQQSISATSSSNRTSASKQQSAPATTANKIQNPPDDGLDYCVNLLQKSKIFNSLTSDLEISKATRYIDKQQFDQAIETLKMMEASGKANQNSRSSSMAATNLSLLYSLKKEFNLAVSYAEQAISIDLFNANAYVNLGNSLYYQKDYEHAEICYKKAIEADINCFEAHYNLGLLYRTIKQNDQSLASLIKLESSMKMFHPLMVQAIKIYISIGDNRKSLELLDNLMNVAPRDPTLLIEMSELAETQNDYSTMKILTDAYKCLPSHIKTMERLVAIYINGGAFEKAIEILEECTILRPDQDKWPMMIAACHRRSGDYHQALNSYRKVHSMFPDNTSCLKNLVILCNDLGLSEAKLYESKLNKTMKKSSSGHEQSIHPAQEDKPNLFNGDSALISSDMRHETKEDTTSNETKNNLDNRINSYGNEYQKSGTRTRILEEDLLKISARPSTSERIGGDFYGDSSEIDDEDTIINIKSEGRF